ETLNRSSKRVEVARRRSASRGAKPAVSTQGVTFSEVNVHSSGGGWITVPFAGGASSRTCDLKKLASTKARFTSAALTGACVARIVPVMNRRTFLTTSASAAAGIAASGAFDVGLARIDAKAQDGNAIAVDPAPLYELSPYLFMQFMEPLGATDGSVEAA